MEELIKIFSDHELSKNKCIIFSGDYENALSLEEKSINTNSPGVVIDDENIARLIFSPIHYDAKNDEIVAAAFHDVRDKGLSVNRLEHCNVTETHSAGLDKAKKDQEAKPDRAYIGFCVAKAGKVRDIVENDVRIFTIYDSALPDAKYHADVCQIYFDTTEPNLTKKAANLNRRTLLQEAFNNFIKHS